MKRNKHVALNGCGFFRKEFFCSHFLWYGWGEGWRWWDLGDCHL